MTERGWRHRAHDELQAAGQLLGFGHAEAAVSRAYYAAVYAAKAALDHLGKEQSTHSAVISAFGQLVVKEQGASTTAGRALNRLHDSRTRADYTLGPTSDADARNAIDRAKIVVDAVDAWLADH